MKLTKPLLAAALCRGALILASALGAATAAEPSGSAPQATPGKVSVLSGAQVIQILDDTVEWYRALGTQQENATQPSDLLILFANRQTADKVVSLAFDIARANAELLSSEADSDTDAQSQSQSHTQQQAQLDGAQQAIQQEMAADKTKA